MSVLVAVPVLRRPERVWPLADSLAASIEKTFCSLLFVCSPGDTAELEAVAARAAAVADVHALVVEWEPGQGDWARKINAAYHATTAPWVFTGADDLHFHPGWADRAIEAAERTGALVVGTNDLGNPRVTSGKHATHSLVARSYADEQGTIDGPGSIITELYRHNFCDDELIGTAKARGVYTFAADSHVEHLHPHWGKAERDEVYDLGEKDFMRDRILFTRRRQLWATRRR